MAFTDDEASARAREVLSGKSRGLATDAHAFAEYIEANKHRLRRTRNHPRIGLDVDGPLANFTGRYLEMVFKRTGSRVSEEAIDRFAIAEAPAFALAANSAGISPRELKKYVDECVKAPGFCESIEIQPGAITAVEALKEIGEVFVITSPWDSSPTWMYERLHWVHDHFGIDRGHIVQSGKKHFACFDLFVDDKASHVREWEAEWPGHLGVLFAMPHNEKEEGLARGGWPFILEQARTLVRV